MASVDHGNEIFDTNPYETHPALSQTEADVLWEYAKLAQHIKGVRSISSDANGKVYRLFMQLVAMTRKMSEGPDQTLLAQLRVLERKMGLVLTLVRIPFAHFFRTLDSLWLQYKASVWAVINEQPAPETSGSYVDDTADLTIRH